MCTRKHAAQRFAERRSQHDVVDAGADYIQPLQPIERIENHDDRQRIDRVLARFHDFPAGDAGHLVVDQQDPGFGPCGLLQRAVQRLRRGRHPATASGKPLDLSRSRQLGRQVHESHLFGATRLPVEDSPKTHFSPNDSANPSDFLSLRLATPKSGKPGMRNTVTTVSTPRTRRPKLGTGDGLQAGKSLTASSHKVL
jgi:hypothetical protein